MLEKLARIIKKPSKTQQTGQIIFRKSRKIRIPLNERVKQFLRWFGLTDEFGEELLKEEDAISQIFEHWSKTLLLWLFNVIYTGSLFLIPISLFYEITWESVPFHILAIGIGYYVIIEMLKEVRNIIKKGTNG